MLGSPCSPCCGICGIDWSLASSVEVEIEAVDYYSRWHARSLAVEDPTGTSRDYYFSLGFKGSRFNGTFTLDRTFISDSLQFVRRSEWQYLATDTPQFCTTSTGYPYSDKPGLHATLWYPERTSLLRAFELRVEASCLSYYSIGAPSYVDLSAMECSAATGVFRKFYIGQVSHAVACTAPVSRPSGGFQAAESSISEIFNPELSIGQRLRFSFALDGGSMPFGWQAQTFGTIGVDPSNWIGGFETVANSITPPPFINVRKVSSTLATDPEKAPSSPFDIPLSQILKVKRVTVLQ